MKNMLLKSETEGGASAAGVSISCFFFFNLLIKVEEKR